MILRHDDFDFRLSTEEYIEVHEQFVKAKLTETAVVQLTTDGQPKHIDPKLVDYMLKTPYWDIQLHGWGHYEYDKMYFKDVYRDLAASIGIMNMVWGKRPSVWYPPWNRRNLVMDQAASALGMTISNESNDIAKFVREAKDGHFLGSTVYFHAWNRNERILIPEMLNMVLTLGY